MEYIIKNDVNEFLTGSNTWSDEYPDAEIYTTLLDAKIALRKIGKTGNFTIFKNYGLDSESIVYEIRVAKVF